LPTELPAPSSKLLRVFQKWSNCEVFPTLRPVAARCEAQCAVILTRQTRELTFQVLEHQTLPTKIVCIYLICACHGLGVEMNAYG